MLHAAVTDAILGAFFRVYNSLGYGFLEKVYQNALAYELSSGGFNVITQHPLKVFYRGIVVGEYFADLLVENKVILELKSCESLCDTHAATDELPEGDRGGAGSATELRKETGIQKDSLQ